MLSPSCSRAVSSSIVSEGKGSFCITEASAATAFNSPSPLSSPLLFSVIMGGRGDEISVADASLIAVLGFFDDISDISSMDRTKKKFERSCTEVPRDSLRALKSKLMPPSSSASMICCSICPSLPSSTESEKSDNSEMATSGTPIPMLMHKRRGLTRIPLNSGATSVLKMHKIGSIMTASAFVRVKDAYPSSTKSALRATIHSDMNT
mmetsp:Transcript_24985/g.40138  ORF Transcript_24985/g.40138 Transcript_24985/m.40138 type:complete len:207 (+) Transcript_24985:129-749(+)